LVDGTPDTRGSIATASRRATANDLNAASMMWWAFSPAMSWRCRVRPALADSAVKNSFASVVSKLPTSSIGTSTS